MDKKIINKTVLIAPLDWGLGHATRCIPIVHLLLQKKCRVLIACSGQHKDLLQEAFPNLEFLSLQGYGITYAKKNLLYNLAKQLPQFWDTVNNENKWLDKTIEDHKIDLVISDNRYGLWSGKIPCVFITHQLQLQMPFVMDWAKKIIQKKLYRLIENFSVCWVPDIADKTENFSGKLGHPIKMPNIPVKYIGPLSRFEKDGLQEKKYCLMICLSGPEPQRSIFESIISTQLKTVKEQVLLVRGKPGSNEVLPHQTNVTIVNHLPTIQLQHAFEQSNFVLSRCGYSTLMDMQVLACKCIYVPTPGQTEQEYLGKKLRDSGKAIVLKQKGFNLQEAIQAATTFNYSTHNCIKSKILDSELDKLLE